MTDEYEPPIAGAPRRTRASGHFVVLALIVAALLGGGIAVWGGYQLGLIQFGRDRPKPARTVAAPVAQPFTAAAPPAAGSPEGVLDVRLSELEQRMMRLGIQAEAASSNAARAEGLLIALAARRAIEHGSRLGYLEDQLKLRFGNALPNAVDTLIGSANNPVTLDMLDQELQTLSPVLVGAPRDADAWARIRSELAQLFVIRRIGAPPGAPQRRLERARMLVASGRVDAAITEVERLPGRAAASDWLEAARRYVRVQRALDLVETAAVLEPRKLNDASGAPVTIPSAVATPTAAADETDF
jgi:hypothetical protein